LEQLIGTLIFISRFKGLNLLKVMQKLEAVIENNWHKK
jgi:hypothetical protein